MVLGGKKATKADNLRSTAVYRVREIEKLPTTEYPFITRVKELDHPRLFVHSDENHHDDDEDIGVTPQDVGGDFEIAPDVGGVIDPPFENEDENEETERVTPENLVTPGIGEPEVKHYVGNDAWVLKTFEITRTHKDPRGKLFSPLTCNDPPPIPLHRFDVERTTTTDSEELDTKKIEDVWDGSINDTRSLGFTWTGEATFFLRPEIKDRQVTPTFWVDGSRIRLHKGPRTFGLKSGVFYPRSKEQK